MILFTIINLVLVVLNIWFSARKAPKWEYYKEGIRFYNKKNEIIIEHDKPLK